MQNHYLGTLIKSSNGTYIKTSTNTIIIKDEHN